MKYINKFKTTREFETAKEKLQTLEHYTVYNAEDTKIYLKPQAKIIIDLNGYTDSLLYFNERIQTEEGLEEVQIQLEPTITHISDAPYGFYISGGENYDTGLYNRPIFSIQFNDYNTSKIANMSHMFDGCNILTSLDLSQFDTTNVTNMSYMFTACKTLTSLDLSNFDTTNVTNMSYMFLDCNSLISLDLSNFDITNVTNMSYMFYRCQNLNYITCKQKFKEWCWTNQDTIQLPTAMREGGSGTWNIVN